MSNKGIDHDDIQFELDGSSSASSERDAPRVARRTVKQRSGFERLVKHL